MPLTANGLVKLLEECGELVQIIGKKLAYWTTDDHPDGQGGIKARLENEIADVLGAIDVVIEGHHLDRDWIEHRRAGKAELFRRWRDELAGDDHGIDRDERRRVATVQELGAAMRDLGRGRP
jgi:NTP pyrophosphatase (non-canonical NTP hydrolase)